MKRLGENPSCYTLEIKELNLYEPYRNTAAILRRNNRSKRSRPETETLKCAFGHRCKSPYFCAQLFIARLGNVFACFERKSISGDSDSLSKLLTFLVLFLF